MNSVTEVPNVEDKKTNTSRIGRVYWIVGGVVAFLVAGWFVLQAMGVRLFGPPEFHGTVVQSPSPEANFTLTAHTGEKMSLYDFRGKVVLIYFGYTFCPDACPATMVELKKAKEALGRDGDKIQVLLVTLDPARDTPEVLADYVSHFDPSFIGMTGSEDEIAAAAIPFGIFYEKREGTAATGYLLDHTAAVAVLDQESYLRLIYPFGTRGDDIAADLAYLINR
ncbi:MAG: SCO family protein [Anaerolineae bacterium]